MLPVVFYLDLSQNNISRVEPQAFDGLLQLQLLNLTGNGLNELPNGVFKGKFILYLILFGYNFKLLYVYLIKKK